MGSTYNPSSSFLPTHSINKQTCIVLQQKYFLLDDDNVQEISEREYNTRVGATFEFGDTESFDPSSIVIAHELVYDPKVITDNNVLVLDAFPVAVNLRQLKRNRDLERRVANRQRRLATVSSGDDNMSYSSASDSEDSTMSHDLLRNDWKCSKGCGNFTCEHYKELKDHERICSAVCRFQTIVRRRLVRKREEVRSIFSGTIYVWILFLSYITNLLNHLLCLFLFNLRRRKYITFSRLSRKNSKLVRFLSIWSPVPRTYDLCCVTLVMYRWSSITT